PAEDKREERQEQASAQKKQFAPDKSRVDHAGQTGRQVFHADRCDYRRAGNTAVNHADEIAEGLEEKQADYGCFEYVQILRANPAPHERSVVSAIKEGQLYVPKFTSAL